MNLRTFVINLDRDTERMAEMAQRLNALQLPFERVPAVLGRSLGTDERSTLYDADANRRHYHSPLVDGEIGCYASHLRLWQRLAAEAVSAAQAPAAVNLVLEDDVLLDASVREVADALGRCASGWDMVKLMGRRREAKAETLPLTASTTLLRYRRPPSLTGAYLISAAGAAKLASARQPFFRPVDIDIRHWWECDLRLFGVFPYPAREAPAAVASTIGQRRGLARGVRWRLRKWWVQSAYLWASQRAWQQGPPPWPCVPETAPLHAQTKPHTDAHTVAR
jgi:glycosyl transferase family 25